MEWIILKTLFSLAAVLLLMVGTVFLLKKYVLNGRSRANAVVEVELLGHTMIHPKRGIFVVKVLNKVIVVGSSEEGLAPLTEIDDAASLREIEKARRQARKPVSWSLVQANGKKRDERTGFAHLLRRQLALSLSNGGRTNGSGLRQPLRRSES